MAQYALPDMAIKNVFTAGLQELTETRASIVKYFNMVKQKMEELHGRDPEKVKAFQGTIQLLHQRMASAPRPLDSAPVAPPQQLNANNLQQLQLQEQQRLAQKANGRMSPDGSPPVMIKPSLTVDDLKLPSNRKRKANEQPQDSSPAKIRSPKPGTPQILPSPQVKAQLLPTAVEKNFKCDRPGCNGAFAQKLELAEHLKMHEREAERRKEEEGRQRFRVDNPLEYAITSVANALNLNRDGTPKEPKAAAAPATPRPGAATPQIKQSSSPLPGFTPLRNVMTPKARSPPQSKVTLPVRTVPGSKAIAPDGEQMPTPPEMLWDQPGSPMALHQCFDGIEEISPLAALDISLFTPAYTPEDTSGEDNGVNVASTYEDWNPFGMKEVCGPEILQEINWEGMETPVCSTKDGANWAEMNGFMMFVH
jgi:hypothetical protein